jgi:ribosomal protein S17E
MLGAMGLSTADGEVRTHLKRMLFEEQAQLEQLSAYYLENHPKIQQLSSSVSKIQGQIAGYGTRRSEMDGEEYNKQLGEMLVSLVSEQLQQTWMHEQALRQEFESAEHEAMMLASQWEGIRILEKEEERLRDLDATLQTRLDNIDIKTSQSDVQVTIVSDAVADNRPVSPKLWWVAFVLAMNSPGPSASFRLALPMDAPHPTWRCRCLAPIVWRERAGRFFRQVVAQRAPCRPAADRQFRQQHYDDSPQ